MKTSEVTQKYLKDTFGLKNQNHFFRHKQGWIVLKKEGAEKILSDSKKFVHLTLAEFDSVNGYAVVKASLGGVETFGEANPKNNITSYPVAMAEKRAKVRAVMQYYGLYEKGIKDEEQAHELDK